MELTVLSFDFLSENTDLLKELRTARIPFTFVDLDDDEDQSDRITEIAGDDVDLFVEFSDGLHLVEPEADEVLAAARERGLVPAFSSNDFAPESVDAINAAWDRIEAWYTNYAPGTPLNPGASEEDIAEVETALSLTLPEDLKASLRRHNGSAEGAWPGGDLLSTTEIISHTQTWREVNGDDVLNPGHETEADEVENTWWSQGWIALDADGGGDNAVMDLSPAPAGRVGQIVYMDHETGPEYIHAYLSEYLDSVNDDLDGAVWDEEDDYLEVDLY